MPSMMTKSEAAKSVTLKPLAVRVTSETLTVDLADGRTIQVPLDWYPRLADGSPEEWEQHQLSDDAIHWPELDEDIGVEGLLRGAKSGESPRSLKRWLQHRALCETPWLEPDYRMPSFKDSPVQTTL